TTLAAARAQTDAATARDLQREAWAYQELASRFLAPVTPELIAIGGLSGAGKSTVAVGLAPLRGPSPGAVVLRSDVIRKRIFGLAPEARLPKRAYERAVTAQVYSQIADIASLLLDSGCCVVVDAVYAEPAERDVIEAVARNADAPFQGIWLSAPQDVLQGRVAGRCGDASDADGAIVKQQLTYDLGPVRWSAVDASGPRDATLRIARGIIEASFVAGSRDGR
ncbi:MAG: AAA family ATPase, partial [Alphaproteobacteria bacterium]|nr:AAA family ATPase [Alphaproteobacteria bacterium]